MANKDCSKCKGTGIVKEVDGSCHTCWECLENNEMDQHSKEVKESRIKL